MEKFREIFEGMGYSFGFGDFDKVDFEDKSLKDIIMSLKSINPKGMKYKDNMVVFYTDQNNEEKVSNIGDKVRNYDYDVVEKNGKTWYIISINPPTIYSRKNMKNFFKAVVK